MFSRTLFVLLGIAFVCAGCATTGDLGDKRQAESLLNQGYTLYRQGDTQRAVRAWLAAVEKDPALYKAHYNLGTLYQETNRPEQAYKEHSKALEIEPDFVPALVNRGLLAAEQGQTEQALADLTRARQLRPNSASILFNLGRLKAKQGKDSQAADLFSKALDKAPNMSPAFNNLGIIHLERGNYAQAASSFKRAIESSENNADYYFNRAVARERQGDLKGAFSDYTRVIEKDPDHASAYYNRGLLRIHRGREDSGCLDLSVACDLGLCNGLRTLMAKGQCQEAAAKHDIELKDDESDALGRVRQPARALWPAEPGDGQDQERMPPRKPAKTEADKAASESPQRPKAAQPKAIDEPLKPSAGSGSSTEPARAGRDQAQASADSLTKADQPEPAADRSKAVSMEPEAEPAQEDTSLPPGAKAAYQASLEVLLEDKDPLRSRGMLQGFIRRHPQSDLLPNAQYWLGETYYVRKEYRRSIQSFQEVLDRFPRHHKAPDALLKIGLARYSLGQKQAARQALQRIIQEHASSRAAQVAQRKLRSLF